MKTVPFNYSPIIYFNINFLNKSVSIWYAGLARGGQQIATVKKYYRQAIEILVELAGLQATFLILDEALKVSTVQPTTGMWVAQRLHPQ